MIETTEKEKRQRECRESTTQSAGDTYKEWTEKDKAIKGSRLQAELRGIPQRWKSASTNKKKEYVKIGTQIHQSRRGPEAAQQSMKRPTEDIKWTPPYRVRGDGSKPGT